MTVAVGFFDGVHLGHQAILRDADRALTFTNHPLAFLMPARAPRLIMTREERRAAIEALGVPVTMLDFNAALANETSEQFLQRLRALVDAESLRVRCGANWRFGKGGAGDAAWLRAHGVDVTVVPYATYKDDPISSTRIRRALEAGAIADANAMLGRSYAVSGEIVRGKGLGRQMGFPTINLVAPRPLPFGAYAVEIGGARAVANYGLAPTMGARAWKVPMWEIHVLGDMGRRPLGNSFRVVRFLRPERKFASVEELAAQIASDCQAAARLI